MLLKIESKPPNIMYPVNDAISSQQFRETFRNNPAFKKVVNDAGSIVDELLALNIKKQLSRFHARKS